MFGLSWFPNLSFPLFLQLQPGVALPSPQELLGRILVKNKKRRTHAKGTEGSVRKRVLEQTPSSYSDSSGVGEPGSPALGRCPKVI